MTGGGRPWEPGDIAAGIATPIYAFRIHSSLGRPHAHMLNETEWIAANERAVEELGPRRWLEQLVAALARDHESPSEPEESFAIADPYPAMTIDPTLCEEYPPMVDEETWLAANARGLREDAGAWLRSFVSVLKGAYPE